MARDDNYTYMIKKLSESTSTRHVNKQTMDKYANIMPERILRYWQEEGFCQFQHGFYSTLNPDDWQDVVDVWLANTPFVQHGPFYAISKTAFGELFLFNPNTGVKASLDPILGAIHTGNPKVRNPNTQDYDFAIDNFFGGVDLEYIDFEDLHDQGMFKPAQQKCGELAWNEMYAFEPAFSLASDAAINIQHVVKLNAQVHMLLLRDLIDQPRCTIRDSASEYKKMGIDLDAIVAKRIASLKKQ